MCSLISRGLAFFGELGSPHRLGPGDDNHEIHLAPGNSTRAHGLGFRASLRKMGRKSESPVPDWGLQKVPEPSLPGSWTPKVCRIIAFYRLWAIALPTLGGPGWGFHEVP